MKAISNINKHIVVNTNNGSIYDIPFWKTETAIECINKIRITNYTVLINKVLKRIIDILAGICGIILLIPMTVVVILIKKICGDNESVFFTQERIGKNGKIFKMYKYRTMVYNADDKLDKYLEENSNAKIEYEKYKKLKDDPRVTKVGKILRNSSIDELPQFINILKGEMSLVGPRPYLLKEKKEMGLYYQYIIKNKPGLTGPWQCNGRNLISFKDRLDIDFNYNKKSNIINDFIIIIKTFLKVLIREGAN